MVIFHCFVSSPEGTLFFIENHKLTSEVCRCGCQRSVRGLPQTAGLWTAAAVSRWRGGGGHRVRRTVGVTACPTRCILYISSRCCLNLKFYTIYIYIYSNHNHIIIYKYNLVGGLEHFLFSIIYGMSSFPLTFIFFKMVIAPPTSIYSGMLTYEHLPSGNLS